MKMRINKATGILVLLLSLNAYSQSGSVGGNGGSGEESKLAAVHSDFSSSFKKLYDFLKSNKKYMQKVFPEFKIGEALFTLKHAKIEIVNGKILDRHNVPRTCVNFSSDLLVRCQASKLVKLRSNPMAYYVLALHEVLSLMGVEETSPRDSADLEGYSVSKRITRYIDRSHEAVFQVEEKSPAVAQFESAHGLGLELVYQERLPEEMRKVATEKDWKDLIGNKDMQEPVYSQLIGKLTQAKTYLDVFVVGAEAAKLCGKNARDVWENTNCHGKCQTDVKLSFEEWQGQVLMQTINTARECSNDSLKYPMQWPAKN